MKATKLTAHAQYHVTCAQGVPQNHTYQFFDPELSIYYTTVMGLCRVSRASRDERVEPCCFNMADDEQAIVLACTSLVVFMLLYTQILFVPSNKIN